MSVFNLDNRLEADSHFIADGPLSQLRLMDDERFAWLIIVPRVTDAVEWVDLDAAAQGLLLAEINQAANLLRICSPCDKLNIGALGNIVRQLHVHVIARIKGDSAWPGPVWGSGAIQRLSEPMRQKRLEHFRAAYLQLIPLRNL